MSSHNMYINARVILACLCLYSAAAVAQVSSSSGGEAPKGGYIRRFSVGATLGVLGLPFTPTKSTTGGSGSISNTYDTTAASRRVGYGLTGQIAITDHFAVAASAIYRRVGFLLDTTTTIGVTTLTTTGTHEDTRARTFEIPVTARYFVKDRHTKPPHFFMEGGAAILKASSVRSSIATIDSSGTKACCTDGKPDIANRTVYGWVGGLGVILIDPIGIRVTPEVRYTRWQKQMFSSLSTGTERNQIEAVISLSW